VSEFAVRPYRDEDALVIHGICYHQALMNGFFHGLERRIIGRVVSEAVEYWAVSPTWTIDVVTPTDPDLSDEVCGFSIRSGASVWAFAYVKPAYRGRGAWRALREAAGLRDGGVVEVILGSPNALRLARQRYKVFFTPFRILERQQETTP
jgi:GNAT superfamily N-acetyltransferase